MSSRRNPIGDKTQPGGPDIEPTEDANTVVFEASAKDADRGADEPAREVDPPSESQPTAPIPAQVKRAPAPRLKTAPYMIFDAVSAKDAAARKNPALHGSPSQPITPEGESENPVERAEREERDASEADEPRARSTAASNTIPGAGPKAPGASPHSARELMPVRGPEPIATTPRSTSAPDDEGPSRRVVSATGAFVGGILAIAVVAGGAVVGFMMTNRPPSPAPISSATNASTNATTTASTTTNTTASTTSAPNDKPSAPSATTSAPTTSATTPPAESTSPPPVASANDDKPLPKEPGNHPSKASLDRMLAATKPELVACVKGQPKALYSVKITFDPATGKPTDAQTFVPIRGTVAGGCVLGAAYGARVNPYAGPPFTAELKFAP